jgi:hypothetical protein
MTIKLDLESDLKDAITCLSPEGLVSLSSQLNSHHLRRLSLPLCEWLLLLLANEARRRHGKECIDVGQLLLPLWPNGDFAGALGVSLSLLQTQLEPTHEECCRVLHSLFCHEACRRFLRAADAEQTYMAKAAESN